MNFDISKLFPGGKRPNVKIRTLRPMQLAVDGKSRHVDEGEEIEITNEVFRGLSADDFQLIDSGRAKLEIADPTPLRPQPESLPTGWENKLPKCFADWWRLTEELRCARLHVKLIRDTKVKIFGTDAIDISGENEGVILAGSIMGGIDNRMNYHSTLKPIDLGDPATRKLARYLETARNSAADYLERLLQSTDLPIQRAFYACGNHRLDEAEKLQIVIDEIRAIGFDIFAMRLSALGLGEGHVRRLYSGSSDFFKYGNIVDTYTGGTCFAGFAEDGVTMRVYSDTPVTASASYAMQDAERFEELQPLLKQARAELAAAKKATAKAA